MIPPATNEKRWLVGYVYRRSGDDESLQGWWNPATEHRERQNGGVVRGRCIRRNMQFPVLGWQLLFSLFRRSGLFWSRHSSNIARTSTTSQRGQQPHFVLLISFYGRSSYRDCMLPSGVIAPFFSVRLAATNFRIIRPSVWPLGLDVSTKFAEKLKTAIWVLVNTPSGPREWK